MTASVNSREPLLSRGSSASQNAMKDYKFIVHGLRVREYFARTSPKEAEDEKMGKATVSFDKYPLHKPCS